MVQPKLPTIGRAWGHQEQGHRHRPRKAGLDLDLVTPIGPHSLGAHKERKLGWEKTAILGRFGFS